MTRKLILGLSATACVLPALAGNFNYVPSGPASVIGPVGNAEIGSSGRFNPSAAVESTQSARFPLLDVTVNLQLRGLGEFNTVFEDMEDRLDAIDRTFDAYSNDDASVGDVLAEVNNLETTLDNSVQLLADNFYAKPGGIANLPFTPLDLNFGDAGTFSFGISSLTQGRLSLLHGPIEFDIDAQTVIDAEDSGEELDPVDSLRTTSSIYLKQAQVFNADFGYSRALPVNTFLDNLGVTSSAGVRGTLIAHNLQKHLYPLKDLIRSTTGDNSRLSDDIVDDVGEGFTSYNYDVALDVGLTFKRDNTRLGLTAFNLNRPVLEYNVLGGDCAALDSDKDQTECYHAEYFASIGDISLEEQHAMNPFVTLDLSQSFLDNRLVLAASADLLQKTDLFGERSQNLNLAFLAQPERWYWPRLRLGVGKDLTDFDATQLGMGLSFFNVLQLDAAVNSVIGDLFSDDMTRQGNALRSASASASVSFSF